MQVRGERLGEAIGQRLDEDGVVVVELALECRASSSAPSPAVTANAPR